MKNNIFNKQNEDYILDALFSQRYYYDLANKQENVNLILIFVACILGSFTIDNLTYQIIVNLVFGIIVFGLSRIIVSNIKKGAKIKKYIDYKLFSFDNDEHSIIEAKKYIFDVKKKHLKNYQQQISNNGNSTPPGLRDWYYDENKGDFINQVKSCQLQNIAWDKEISKIYLILLTAIFSSMFFIYLIISCINKCDILEFVAGFIPFANIIGYLVQKILQYNEVNKNIVEIKIKTQKPTTKKILLDIQKDIDLRRENEFAPPNFIHKIISKNMHEKIKFVSK